MARYDRNRKLERDKALIEYWQRHPEATYEEIGRIFGGISKQRVHQIIRAFRSDIKGG